MRWFTLGQETAIKAPEDPPRVRLARMLTPAAYEALTTWIDARGRGQHHWSSGGYRQRMTRAAVTLAACGVSTEAMITYALGQVMELHGTDLLAENVDETATAYAIIHSIGAGPATKGIVRQVREIYRG